MGYRGPTVAVPVPFVCVCVCGCKLYYVHLGVHVNARKLNRVDHERTITIFNVYLLNSGYLG